MNTMQRYFEKDSFTSWSELEMNYQSRPWLANSVNNQRVNSLGFKVYGKPLLHVIPWLGFILKNF